MRLNRFQYELLARPETVYQAVLHVISPLLQVGVIIYLATVWKTLPDMVPSHYDAAGAITEYSSKGLLWMLPVIGCVCDLIIWAAAHLPEDTWSTGVKVTPANAVRVRLCIRDLIAEERLAMSLMFAGMAALTIAMPEHFPAAAVAPAIIALISIPIVRYLVRVLKR